jgi:nucleoside-diphosphate-sugar epimerase
MGFLGRRQVEALRGSAEVHAIARRPMEAEPGVTAHVLDLEDRDALLYLFACVRPEFVIHLAGFANGKQGVENLHPSLTGDLLTTVHVLEACLESGCGRLVLTGSLEEAGEDGVAASPYAVSKLAAAHYAELCHRLYGLPVVTAKVFMTYGPGQRAHKLAPQLMASLESGQPFEVRSPAREVDWVYVDDVVEALALAAASPGLEGMTIDVGSGVLTSVGEFARLAGRLMGREDVVRTATPDRLDERVRAADVAETQRVLGWRAKVSLEDGLRRTVEAYMGQEARG